MRVRSLRNLSTNAINQLLAEGAVYVGRRMTHKHPLLSASPLGNPWKVWETPQWQPLYRKFLMELGPDAIKHIKDDSTLLCWCLDDDHPKTSSTRNNEKCHAQVVAKAYAAWFKPVQNWEPIDLTNLVLADDEVFVFGSNLNGFHGAGTAGLAMRGDSRNNWRQDSAFREMLRQGHGVGKWARLNTAHGYQRGTVGCSYAIPTVTKPGARRSIELDVIRLYIDKLHKFALFNSHLKFLITPLGEGYAGYSTEEMDTVWAGFDWPTNCRFIGVRGRVCNS